MVVSECCWPFCLFCTFLKPVVGLEMQRSLKDKFKLEYSVFTVQNIFCTFSLCMVFLSLVEVDSYIEEPYFFCQVFNFHLLF